MKQTSETMSRLILATIRKSKFHILEVLKFKLCVQHDMKTVLWIMLIHKDISFRKTQYVKVYIKCN